MLCLPLFVLGLTLGLAPAGLAEEQGEQALPLTKEQKRQRLLLTNGVGLGLVTLWGVAEWDYFSRSPHAQSEGWFGYHTNSGGADKLGHMYSTYAFAHGLSALYNHWGFETEESGLYGALTSWAIMGYMELGDAFSDYGFAYEDMVANSAGALLGYLLYRDEKLAEKLDLRWEYGLQPTKGDLLTDYENSKFLLALKLNGFESCRQNLWRHLEFHLGYYTRGFDDMETDRFRKLYLAISINLTDLLAGHGWQKSSTALRYLQLPYSYLPLEYNFD